ncbi:MAG: FAD-dependent oxidoreductase [Planctomycetota bacterium]
MIGRDPEHAASVSHDLVVVGGGIYGSCLALEAARRGLRPLLLERDDFGGGSSFNSLRIVHGGLRYLQSLDVVRLRDSVRERRWFLRTFPELVRPLPCLLPLYGEGLHRPSTFRLALLLTDSLSRDRNAGVSRSRHLPGGRVVPPSETAALFAAVRREGLRGAGLWHDAVMLSSERVLVEILRWACSAGALALNYTEAVAIETLSGRVTGVCALDRESGRRHVFRAPVVVNCAGPDCRSLAARCDRDVPALFRPCLAFNLLLDVEPPSRYGIAVSPDRPGARTYFLLPWGHQVLAGTYHLPWSGEMGTPAPPEEAVSAFLDDLREAVPNLGVSRADVRRVLAGWQPAKKDGSEEFATRDALWDHAREGGPAGFFSLSGVKYTTARLVAERAIRRVFPGRPLPAEDAERPARGDPGLAEHGWLDRAEPGAAGSLLRRVVTEEAVVHLDDLLLRRSSWALDATEAADLGGRISDLLGWEPARRASELERLAGVGGMPKEHAGV